jgi:hypothetical protein
MRPSLRSAKLLIYSTETAVFRCSVLCARFRFESGDGFCTGVAPRWLASVVYFLRYTS